MILSHTDAIHRVRDVQPDREVRRTAPLRVVGTRPLLPRLPRQLCLHPRVVARRRAVSAAHFLRAAAARAPSAGAHRAVTRCAAIVPLMWLTNA